MANIKKTFNFRNGVQVDDDNLIVNQTGLVGIGTTVPTEALDVRGKVKVIEDPNVAGSGEINATTGIITSLTVTDLTVNGNQFSNGVIGVGISVGTAGIITATEPSGLVTYFGDGKNLLNLPTSQWVDTDVGLGYTSIYAQGGVGVGTVDPRFTFQVSGNNDLTNFEEGVGINDKGGIVATGVITATTFKGNVDGDVVGLVNSSGIGTFNGLNATGRIVGAATSNVIPFLYSNLSDLPSAVTYHGAFAHVHNEGKAYFAHAANWYELINRELTGVVGTSADSYNIGSLNVGVATANKFVGNIDGNIDSIGISTFNILNVTGSISGDTVSGILTTGSLTAATSNIGVATASALNVQGKLGINNNNPSSDIHVVNLGIATVSVVGDTYANVQIGQKDLVGIGESTAQFKFGDTPKTLEIINGDTGDVNTIIHGGGFTGINTGSFNWMYGVTSNTLMSLDYTGKLAIGKASADYPLDVVGVATFGNSVFVKNELEVNSTLTANGSATIGGTLGITSDTTIGGNLNVTGTFNYPSPVPVNQLPDLILSNIFTSTGVSTIRGGVDLGAVQIGGSNGIISGVSTIGVLTSEGDIPLAMGVYAPTANASFNRLGVGNTDPQNALDVTGSIQATQYLGVGNQLIGAAVDFSNAGRGLTVPSLQNRNFMLPPKITTTERSNLAGLAAGAIIYNTTTNKLQVYNGSTWQNLH